MPTTWFDQNAPAEAPKDWFAQNAPPPPAKASADEGFLHHPANTLAAVDDATRSGLQSVARGVRDAAVGAVQMFDPHIKDGENALTANPAARIVTGLIQTGKDAAQIPGAVHDINQSPDPLGTYAQAAQETAGQGAGQALLGAATEGLSRIPKPIATAPVRLAARTAEAAIDQKILPVKKIFKLMTPADKAAGLDVKVPGRDYGLDTAPKAKPAAFPQYDTPAPAPKTSESAAPETNAHPDAAQFEQTFGQPIDNYIDENGKFNKKDFLDEIVKPKTEPPNAVIAKTFGNDGVELVNKLNGKPLEKWESSAPDSEPKGGSARLRAKAILKGDAGSAGAPGSIYENRDVTGELTKEVPARGFLKKMGADENAILTNKTRTPGEHADSVNYHRQQIREGKMQPAELHVDEDNNVIGGDGRHRALAAIQEGGENAKIHVRVIRHSFRGVN